MRPLSIAALAALSLCSWASAQETPIVGPAVIVDGDTIRIGDTRIRLWGIDAPERRQSCTMDDGAVSIGEAARDYLTDIIGGRELVCERRDVDRYGRTVARCTVDGVDVAAAMVTAGWAWAYTRYAGDLYVAQQESAEAAERGLWAGAAVCELPSEWRADH